MKDQQTNGVREFFAKITKPLLTCLASWIEKSQSDELINELARISIHYHTMEHVIPNLTTMLKHIDACLYDAGKACQYPPTQTVLVTKESKHPYVKGVCVQKLVSIPGATQLHVTFDPQSCTTGQTDYLQIFVKTSNNFKRVAGPLWGPFEQWPKTLVVAGDSLALHFTSSSTTAMYDTDNSAADKFDGLQWGYRVQIQAEVVDSEMSQLRWLEDISCLLVRIHNIVASNFIDLGKIRLPFQSLHDFALLFAGGLHHTPSFHSNMPSQTNIDLEVSAHQKKKKNCIKRKNQHEVEDMLTKIYRRTYSQDKVLEKFVQELFHISAKVSGCNLLDSVDVVSYLNQAQLAIFAALLKHTGADFL
ncbi:hypothetical protein RFI_01823, partial [Reticulomyxa filosa]